MKYTLRFWLTLLFAIVVLTAIAVLSLKLLSSLSHSIGSTTGTAVVEQAKVLMHQVEPVLSELEGSEQRQEAVVDFARSFEDDVWIYGRDGRLLYKAHNFTKPGSWLAEARDATMQGFPFRRTELSTRRQIVIAGVPIKRGDTVIGAVVVANNGAEALGIVDETRYRLFIAAGFALLVAGVLGVFFSEIITRQVAGLKRGALAMAEGNFDLRLKGLFPDEIGELVVSFNIMAEKLGNVFRALRAQQQEMSTVVETMGEGLVALRADGSLRLANSAAYELVGSPLRALASKPIEDAFAGTRLVGPIREALACKHVAETAETGDRVVLMHASPTMDGERCDGVVLIFRDVTRQTKLERAQRDFISNASHELRTPVSALKGFLELLGEGASDDPAVRDRFLGTMEMEINRLERLVDELFTLSQLDSEQIYLKLARCEVADIVHNVATIAGPLMEAKNMTITTDVEPFSPLIWCDRDRIVQVLLGFVDNAIKHSQAGADVVLFARREIGGVRVGVRDAGEGIPAGELNKIFERFYRLTAKSDTEKRGAGLGLSIAKEIVEAHGSNIRVESVPHEGSAFSFVLRPAEEASA